MVFTGFVFLGLVYGLSQGGRHHGRRLGIAPTPVHLDRLRPDHEPADDATSLRTACSCAPSSVCSSRACSSLQYFHSLAPEIRENLESLTEHAASIHVDVVIIFVFAIWLLPALQSRATDLGDSSPRAVCVDVRPFAATGRRDRARDRRSRVGDPALPAPAVDCGVVHALRSRSSAASTPRPSGTRPAASASWRRPSRG